MSNMYEIEVNLYDKDHELIEGHTLITGRLFGTSQALGRAHKILEEFEKSIDSQKPAGLNTSKVVSNEERHTRLPNDYGA